MRSMGDTLESLDVGIHYVESDVDHNRTVTAFSGQPEVVETALFRLAELALPSIDLNRHAGAHPRIGALDVCPFIPFKEPESAADFNQWVDGVASAFAEKFEVPVFLYEKSARSPDRRSLPRLRRPGFGGLLEADLRPDHGPDRVHERNGATVMGWRDFLIALNVFLKEEHPTVAQNLAAKIRANRDTDERFTGVRALGLYLPTREQSQLSMNITQPDLTPLDPILRWAYDAAARLGVHDDGAELIGVIRAKDMEHTTLLAPKPNQVVEIR